MGIKKQDFVRINSGVVTFWIPDSEPVEGRLTVQSVNRKITVMLSACFYNQKYRYYWTGRGEERGEEYIEWTHFQDLGKQAPIRWTKIPSHGANMMAKRTNARMFKSFKHAGSDDSRGHSSHRRGASHSGH